MRAPQFGFRSFREFSAPSAHGPTSLGARAHGAQTPGARTPGALILGALSLGLLLLGGCAKKPEAIAAAYVSHMQYQAYTCPQLAAEASRLDAALAQVSEAQRNARSGDVAGVILLGLPVSSMSGGNVADQVASVKGQQVAVQQAMNLRNCGGYTYTYQ